MRHYLLALSLVISACGGSSDGGDPSPPPPPPPPPTTNTDLADNLNFVLPDNIQQHQAIGIMAQLSGGHQMRSLSWQQISGPDDVFITAPNSQIIGFDVTHSGDYSFELSFVTTDNETATKVLDFSVQASDLPQATVRLDHVVSEGGKVSLRAAMSHGSNASDTVSWTQTSGPQVSMDLQQPPFLFFTAPRVQQDTVLEFEAEITTADGDSYQDKAYVLVNDVEIDQNSFFSQFREQVVSAEMQAYVPDGPYAHVLAACVYSNTRSQSCDFNTLPLLGMQTQTPTIDDVMERVLVSHPWMGDRFRQFLQQSVTSPDMLKMLRAVTAIVISYDVRPSFYWTVGGAIYLDGDSFWLTPQERDSLNDIPDFRSDFGADLQFSVFWRYAKDNQYYLLNYPHEDRSNRTFSHLESDLSWLMYHELAHANDYFPPVSWQTISRNDNPLSSADQRGPESDNLVALYPLTSSQLPGLAQVRYAGEAASSQQRALTASDIVNEFTPDRAVNFYSYFTPREDYALLFERYMMEYRLGVQGDVAIISNNNNPEFNVTWGQRSRASADSLLPRVKLAVNNILPDHNFNPQNMSSAELMEPGIPWRENLINDQVGVKQLRQPRLMMHHHQSRHPVIH